MGLLKSGAVGQLRPSQLARGNTLTHQGPQSILQI
jgi:hypothetical protein